MFVSVCNLQFLHLAKIWANSLLRFGGGKKSQLALVAFGNLSECRIIEHEISRIFGKVRVLPAALERDEFRFLGPNLDRWYYFVGDYLRAWAGKYVERYIYMDCDIIVRKNI